MMYWPHPFSIYTAEQRKITADSFFFVGEMGINDYFAALLGNRTVGQTWSLVPHVVGAICSAITVITPPSRRANTSLPFGSDDPSNTGRCWREDHRARTVMVMGMPPLGSEPYLLTLFPGGPLDYDPVSGCNTAP
jgi:hypothetical protein